MKYVLLFLAVFVAAVSTAQTNTFPSTGAAGIGTISPNASSLLDITSTSKGILIPRMTLIQRNAIVSPVQGLLIYQTNNTAGFYYYDGGKWVAVSPKGVNKSLSNLTTPTAINVSLLPNVNNAFDLGSPSLSWKNIYADSSYFIGGNRVLNIAGSNNTFLGNTGNNVNTGTDNVFVGFNAGLSNTSGLENTAIGSKALYSNTTGSANIASGFQALYHNTTGNDNIANGTSALYSNTTGAENIAIGTSALASNTTGVANIANGGFALEFNTEGSRNVASGYEALASNKAGSDNIASGTRALFQNTTGFSNVAIGASALYSNITTSNLVAIGDSALYNNTGFYNTALGSKALYANSFGVENTALGFNTLISNTTGSFNTATGKSALYSNISGYYNTAIGESSLSLNTSGTGNTATGKDALYSNTSGAHNTAIGVSALYSNTTAYYNTATGEDALSSNTTGTGNTAIGNNTQHANATGSHNTAIGKDALGANVTGSYNTAIGDSTDVGSNSLNNATAIGSHALATSSNSLVLGSINGVNGATSNVNVGIGTSSPLRKFHIADGGVSGGIPNANATIVMEKNGISYLQMLTPNANENGVLFGVASNNASGGIIYNNSTTQKGFQLRTGGNHTRITIDSNGNVAIGNFTATHLLQLNVDDAAKPSTSTWTIASDERLKTNISDFKEGLDVVKKIRPVWFEYNGKAGMPKGVRSVGILAQEMQKIASYTIGKFKQTDSLGRSEEYLDYNANALFYLLVNSVKELSGKNDQLTNNNEQLKSTVDAMQQQIDDLKMMMQTLQQNLNSCSPCSANSAINKQSVDFAEQAKLQQNVPNPFNHTTTINYTMPQLYSSAKIIVLDQTGNTLKEINLSVKGKGSVNVDAATLASGAYEYSLYVDGRLIDTKQMILTK